MIEGSDGRYYLQAGAIIIPGEPLVGKRRTDQAYMCAGSWRLSDKIGMPLDEIHVTGHVPQCKLLRPLVPTLLLTPARYAQTRASCTSACRVSSGGSLSISPSSETTTPSSSCGPRLPPPTRPPSTRRSSRSTLPSLHGAAPSTARKSAATSSDSRAPSRRPQSANALWTPRRCG